MVDLTAFRPSGGRQYPLADFVRLTYKDFTDANTSANRLTIGHAPTAGVVIRGTIIVVTAYAGSAGTTATIDIGDATDPDRYTASPVNLAATGVTAFTITGDQYSAPTDLLAEFAGTLNTLTAGEVIITYEVVSEGRAHENVIP